VDGKGNVSLPENGLMMMNTGEHSLGRRKSLMEANENHSHFVDYQQGKLNSVDKPFKKAFTRIGRTSRGSTKLNNVKQKSTIYLYDYAKVFIPLDLV
jgi:hypothetical protein